MLHFLTIYGRTAEEVTRVNEKLHSQFSSAFFNWNAPVEPHRDFERDSNYKDHKYAAEFVFAKQGKEAHDEVKAMANEMADYLKEKGEGSRFDKFSDDARGRGPGRNFAIAFIIG